MILFVNDKNEIKDVNTTDKYGLKAIIIDDKDNPFKGWSVAKICCYKVQLIKNRIVGYSPYVDTRIVEQLDRLGITTEINTEDITDAQMALCDNYEMIEVGNQQITDLEMAVCDIYEIIIG